MYTDLATLQNINRISAELESAYEQIDQDQVWAEAAFLVIDILTKCQCLLLLRLLTYDSTDETKVFLKLQFIHMVSNNTFVSNSQKNL